MTAFSELARVLAARMLNGVVAGIAITLLAGLVLRIIRQRNSSTRFAVWFSALLAIVALPWLGGSAGAVRAGTASSAVTLPTSWAAGILIVWAVVAALALARVLLGLWQLRQIRITSAVIDPATLDAKLQRTLQEFRSRKVTLALSHRLPVPAAIGFFKPRIVFPTWALDELSPEELNAILIHELAHLDRWDDWTNLAQKVVRALLFFHPAIWWVDSRLTLEREMACDDIVLSKTANPRGYVECLVTMAEKSFLHRGLAMAQAVVGRMRQTSRRVAQLLDADRPTATRVWKPALCLVTVFSAGSVMVMSRAPQLVAFQDAAPKIAMAVPVPLTKPMVIAASWNEAKPSFGEVRRTSPGKTNSARNKSARNVTSGALQARSVQAGQSDTSLQARRETTPSNDGIGQAVLVVMQTSQFDPSGRVFFTIRVWQVSLTRPGKLVNNPLPAKSI